MFKTPFDEVDDMFFKASGEHVRKKCSHKLKFKFVRDTAPTQSCVKQKKLFAFTHQH